MKPQLKLVDLQTPTSKTAPTKIVLQKGVYIYKRNNSDNWQIYIGVKGKTPIRDSAFTNDEAEARKIAMHRLSDVNYKVENKIPIKRTLFAELCSKYKDELDKKLEQKLIKPASYQFAIIAMNNYFVPYFGKMSISAINRVAIAEYQKWRVSNSIKVIDGIKCKPSGATQNKEETALNKMLEFALDIGLLSQKPTIKKTKVNSNRHPHFTKQNFRKLVRMLRTFIDCSPNASIRRTRSNMYSAIMILVGSGLRKHELMPDADKLHKGLRWCDIDLNAWKKDKSGKMYCKITITKKNCKNNKGREIYFGSTVYWHLKRLNEKVSDRWAQISKVFDSDFRRSFKSFLNWAGMKTNEDGENYCMYSFRHSFATWKIEEGISIKQLADVMGNSVAIIEKHYSHALTANFKENFI